MTSHQVEVFARVVLIATLSLLAPCQAAGAASSYQVGVGSFDVTGPAADVNMMGYAQPEQKAAGVHLRLRSRAFVIAAAGERVVFVNVDACMASQAVVQAVLQLLKRRYGDLYTEKNVCISGIHTHSGPGGYLQYVLYSVTSLGFVAQSFQALVDGIEQSIVMAHENLQPGRIFAHSGELLNASVNRSPNAYLANPAEERARYEHDTDKEMTVLRFETAKGQELGALSWFAVHCTSMNNTNRLINGDNKGLASRLMEDWQQTGGRELEGPLHMGKAERVADMTGASRGRWLWSLHKGARRRGPVGNGRFHQDFVAAFAQSSVGDTSPNTLGAFCIDTGKPCDFNTSTCSGKNELCHGRGPAWPDDSGSNEVIAERQFQAAKDLYEAASAKGELLTGPVGSLHMYVNMANTAVNVTGPDGKQQEVRTCPPAMGFSFAAGTTDGPGAFDFSQGDTMGNLFWRRVSGALRKPSLEQIACHAPKPILLDTGEMVQPYDWQPSTVSIQILRVGNLIILAVPGEFTTMAGRRLRRAVYEELVGTAGGQFGPNTRVVIAGLANSYSSYITTYEEYQIQRYEGASTIYGPHTLSAYIQEFRRMAAALASNSPIAEGSPPPNLVPRQLHFLPPVIEDSTPRGFKFGDVFADIPKGAKFQTGDRVEATFWTGCPRNDLRTEGTFALVERFDEVSKDWVGAYDDDDYCLRYGWHRPSLFHRGHSLATLTWTIPRGVLPGAYRFRHFGASKRFIFSPVWQFTGTSSAFVIVPETHPVKSALS